MPSKIFREMIETKTLSDLPYYLSRSDDKIFHYKKLGISRNKRKLSELMSQRNYIRKKLLKLLLEWKNNNFQSDPVDYNYVINKDIQQENIQQEKIDKLLVDDDEKYKIVFNERFSIDFETELDDAYNLITNVSNRFIKIDKLLVNLDNVMYIEEVKE